MKRGRVWEYEREREREIIKIALVQSNVLRGARVCFLAEGLSFCCVFIGKKDKKKRRTACFLVSSPLLTVKKQWNLLAAGWLLVDRMLSHGKYYLLGLDELKFDRQAPTSNSPQHGLHLKTWSTCWPFLSWLVILYSVLTVVLKLFSLKFRPTQLRLLSLMMKVLQS